MRQVAALFVRADSVYKTMPGVDAWDIERDARKWPGGSPVVAHPPCKRWSVMNHVTVARYTDRSEFAFGNDGGTFEFALQAVRRNGGVIEHPAKSLAFKRYGLPVVGRGPDRFGGWAFEVRQCDWGHRAEKRTWLYVVGAGPDDVPATPAADAVALVSSTPRKTRRGGMCEVMGKAEREHTPPAFAAWLVDLARRCRVDERAAA